MEPALRPPRFHDYLVITSIFFQPTEPFYYFEDLVQATTGCYGPIVAASTGFHCSLILTPNKNRFSLLRLSAILLANVADMSPKNNRRLNFFIIVLQIKLVFYDEIRNKLPRISDHVIYLAENCVTYKLNYSAVKVLTQ